MSKPTPNGFTPLDPGRVNAMDVEELHYWSREFSCSVETLEVAIDAVGEHVAALREWLERQPPGGAG